jgi:hypothetical protein
VIWNFLFFSKYGEVGSFSKTGEKISGHVSTRLFVTGKILCKNEIKNIFFENELILGVFNSQK